MSGRLTPARVPSSTKATGGQGIAHQHQLLGDAVAQVHNGALLEQGADHHVCSLQIRRQGHQVDLVFEAADCAPAWAGPAPPPTKFWWPHAAPRRLRMSQELLNLTFRVVLRNI
jgi:hypothetical protein